LLILNLSTNDVHGAFLGANSWNGTSHFWSESFQAWWFDHNFTFLPVTMCWLWPTAVGVPAIVIWITYDSYKARFRRAKLAATPAT
jgi:hypothetical protein